MKDLFGNNNRGAEFSECGNYRYKLWRIWDNSKPLVMCIGLNPSTANHEKDDATIIHLSKMLQKLEYGGFYMTNLFAWISPHPKDLLTCDDPLGDNEYILSEVEKLCSDVIVCWGAFKEASTRISEVLPRYPKALCFGYNSDGTPMHPLAMMYQGKTKHPKLELYKIQTDL